MIRLTWTRLCVQYVGCTDYQYIGIKSANSYALMIFHKTETCPVDPEKFWHEAKIFGVISN